MSSLIKFCLVLARTGEWITRRIGTAIAWLCALLAIVTVSVVLLRVLFQWGAIGLQESLTYIHALVIMLTAAYTLAEDGHVRVDIFYRRFSAPSRAWVNAVGAALLLLPFAVFSIAISFDFVVNSWAIHEGSADAGGIPAVFLLKSLILANGVLLLIQGLADLARQLTTLTQVNP